MSESKTYQQLRDEAAREVTDSLNTKDSKSFEAETEYLYQKKIADLEAELADYREALQKVTKFLDTDIAMLECESRIRTMHEKCWEQAMYLRDVGAEVLEKWISK